jgi:hypothetical protein
LALYGNGVSFPVELKPAFSGSRLCSMLDQDRHAAQIDEHQFDEDLRRYVAAPDGVSMMAVPEQVPRCGEADIQGFDIPPLAGLPSS